MVEDNHQHSHHDRIAEENRACHTGIHVAKAQVERGGRHRHQRAEDSQADGCAPTDGQRLTLGCHPDEEHQGGESIAVDKYRRRIHAVGIELQGAQGVGTVEDGS